MIEFSTAPERPIQSFAEDKFERSRFIERLTSALVNVQTSKSTGVVVGITGPWGSGKSSILNLLKEHLTATYPEALVIRFDPWLVSGRNDLIAEFFGELIGTIKTDEKRFAKFKKLGSSIAQYGAQLAPIGNLFLPGIGTAVSGGLKAVETALSSKPSLSALRNKLISELEQIPAPIVVLIDELDRVEDNEVRAVAQLVRSVADFHGISYVLAYDPDRVVQALGGDNSDSNRERGRAYLEKIVQLQIPLPVTFDDEIIRLLTADLTKLKAEVQLPDKFDSSERYQELVQLLAARVIHTPRDIRRLVGSFHVLAGMLCGEVDAIDLIAYSALLTKAPATVGLMRQNPDDYLGAPSTAAGIARYLAQEKLSKEDRLNELIPASERSEGVRELVGFLFPALSDDSFGWKEHPDAFRQRRPMLTTLRLGLLPGAYSRDQIKAFVNSESMYVIELLRSAKSAGTIAQLTDRLDETYSDLLPFDQISFWTGVEAFVAKPDCKWMTSYEPMNSLINELSRVLTRKTKGNDGLRAEARSVFNALREAGESTLATFWIRHHIFHYGLYGHDKIDDDRWFLQAEETDSQARAMAVVWRADHINGKLIPGRWGLQPVYTMIDLELWDDICKKHLDDALSEDIAVDGFTLMLYGAEYTTDKATVAKMCDYERYIERAKDRLSSASDTSVRAALKKAVDGGW